MCMQGLCPLKRLIEAIGYFKKEFIYLEVPTSYKFNEPNVP